jgi:hypothetical protein
MMQSMLTDDEVERHLQDLSLLALQVPRLRCGR